MVKQQNRWQLPIAIRQPGNKLWISVSFFWTVPHTEAYTVILTTAPTNMRAFINILKLPLRKLLDLLDEKTKLVSRVYMQASLFVFREGKWWCPHQSSKWLRGSRLMWETTYNCLVSAPHRSSFSIMPFNCPAFLRPYRYKLLLYFEIKNGTEMHHPKAED